MNCESTLVTELEHLMKKAEKEKEYGLAGILACLLFSIYAETFHNFVQYIEQWNERMLEKLTKLRPPEDFLENFE